MVHVTFNEKVECHQYTPAPTENTPPANRNENMDRMEVLASTNMQGQTRFSYDAQFLRSLKTNPLSNICPDVVKKGMEDGKSWADKNSWFGSRSVFAKPLNTYNSRPRRQLYPFYNNNQANFVGANRDEMFAPLEPVGRRRIDTNSRNYHASNYEDHYQSRNLMPEFGQRFDVRTSTEQNTNDEDAVPEWFNSGPTSRNDVIELHGFEGPGLNNENDKINPFGCVDGNTSGGGNSGASSNNGSPPAKSTPAKVTPTPMKNDAQRNKRPPSGRSNIWQNNFDNRQNIGAPLLNEFFKNFPANQNKSNLRVMPQSVEDVESQILYEKIKFRHMVGQMQAQQRYLQEPVPSAAQILIEIDKIIRTSTEAVYKRPEVRILIKNIIESVIPPLNLMNLLQSPSTETHNREAIVAAIKLYTIAKQNALTAMKTRMPTDAELRAHMDAILQDAIIKKRMENLKNELLKMPYQQGGRNLSNQAQSFHQMFAPNTVGRLPIHSQSDFRGQSQPVENVPTAVLDNNLNRWFSPSLLNKGLSRELPQLPISDPLRVDELESSIKQKLKGNEKDVK